MRPIIEVRDVSKRYTIGAAQRRHNTLRDSLTALATAPIRALRRRQADNPETTIWALKDVSFDVKPGEVVGIIGRNGAGKSTLLKVLTRITEPTEGEVKLFGRVASLLEVGTGFHPELTGRENIFLNGAILGMRRAEIGHEFDEIVAFAEVEKFIDTPIKHYSSGMYVRLAFAVAAHLKPEILLVDEVLAVGDAQFQKKCLGKMSNIARGGRTILFVSHNLGALSALCPRAMLLVAGVKHADGDSASVVSSYVSLGRNASGAVSWADDGSAPGNEKVRLESVAIVSEGEITANVAIDKSFVVEIQYRNLAPSTRFNVSVHLLDSMGVAFLASANLQSASLIADEWSGREAPPGVFRTRCEFPGNFLNDGHYSVNVILLTEVTRIEVFAREVVSLDVHDTGAMRQEYGGGWLGVVRPKLAWSTIFLGDATSS